MHTIYLILFWSVPVFIALAALEAGVLWAIRGRYDWRAGVASLVDVLVRQYVVYVYLAFGPADALIGWLYAHRIATVPLTTWPAFAILFLGQELCYYGFHRCSHSYGLLWANHAVHHSPNELNLSAALRFGWTGRLIGANAFFLPLIWVGFPPQAVFVTLSLNLLYQFYLHADWIPKLGPLEWVLNTPSHHRVHHAVNPEYRDRNFGGVLIIFDRIFGTFAEERAGVPCRYGLDVPLHSYNPVWIAFHGFAALARDIWRARSWRGWRRALIGMPAT